MNGGYLRNFLYESNKEREAQQKLELREQEAKCLEAEHLAETRKFKEEQSVIAAPPG